MSNLLNNGRPKKRLLDRGPKIVPAQEFELEPIEEVEVEEALIQEQQPAPTPQQVEAVAPLRTVKKREAAQATSVRVSKTTRNKLNALIQMGKADNVDILVDILIDEYVENNLVKDEKKAYTIVLDILKKRDR